MASLFEQRHEVTLPEYELATRAWRAYCSPSPEAIMYLLSGETSPLPYLRDALLRHLARLPSRRNGLGYVQNRALQLISEGHTTFKALFPMFGRSDPAYGLGDSQFWNDVLRMNQVKEPLIEIEGLQDLKDSSPRDGYHNAAFRVTDEGEATLAGKTDFVDRNGIDHWFGGAHLTNSNVWRWDEPNQTVIRS